jgi:Chaperone of endosialidase
MKIITSARSNSINHAPSQLALLFIPLALAWLALSATAQATCQQGCLANENTALGDDALSSNTTGDNNTATGFQALSSNTTGDLNTATGAQALSSNTIGHFNTATGVNALLSNTTGFENTATGLDALSTNTTGSQNTADGIFALFLNTTGYDNTATGFSALANNTTGLNNTADGVDALKNNTTGNNNIALGFEAGNKLFTGSNNIYIGSHGDFSQSRTIRIGDPSTHQRTAIAGISGVTVAAGVGVVIDASGQLGTAVSSARFKEAINPMDKASEAILALKPVTFHYKHELDPKEIPQFGLVAEDVEKVNPDLVARDDEGKPYTVRYEAVNAMLLNEFLKEHRKNEEQESKIEHQDATIARQQKQINALTAGLQKVSAQLELNKPAPQTVSLSAVALREGGNNQ